MIRFVQAKLGKKLNTRKFKNVVHNEKESKDENLLFVQIKMDAAL